LEALYDRNNDSNILAQFDIDSKYYEIDEMKQINCHTTSDGFKYKILHLNIQGLMSSLENLKHFLNKLESNDIHIDFILLCETFLNEPNQQMHCSIAGYEFICRNRIKRKKGGVAIYINNRYQFKIKDEISTFVEGEYESIFIEVLSNPHNLIIGEIYRIPNTPAQLSLNRYEDSLNKILVNKSHDIIIGTDQNFDYLKISDHKNTADLFNICISHGLIPVITRPTRITHNSATLIDNIYIKLQQTHLASGIITTHLSDHLTIFAFYGKKN
jgi:vacuolar-type H+-ATPase subunit F/Vma7